MPNLEGSETEKNLITALEGEAVARVKYEFYSSQAKKDGYVELKDIFMETSDNEKEHAKVWFKLLHDGEVHDTETNLSEAIGVEQYEWSDMYKNFAKTAKKEGFDDIAELFELTAKIEKEHEKRYKIILNNIKKDRVFKKSKDITWKCQNCGYVCKGKVAPDECPMCSHPQAHFRRQEMGYK